MPPVRLLPVTFLLWALLVAPAAAAPAMAALTLEPQAVPIGMRFSGVTIKVQAEVPAGYGAAVRVMGRTEDLEMKRKGKVAHLLWISVGEVRFRAVPAVYILLTAPPPPLRGWPLGYDALAQAAGWDAALAPELIKLKEQEGCFFLGEGALSRLGPGRDGATDRLAGTFRLPDRAADGEYRADLFGFDGRQVIRLASTTLRLEQMGAARALRTVAREHGLLYGILAVAAAVLAGLGTGYVFQRKRGHPK